ncbi:hypothetical protein BDV93DRAFT_513510 [Ceratobasidium sp. AG-I]|nr:hypothetical protein BDV93DRAFT_513510 [Ceratobasidium sp. AG-I]
MYGLRQDQGWLFAPVVPQDPLQASNADESIVIRPHSNREQDSTTAEMSAMAKGVTKEESTDQQDEILLPNLSALSLSSGFMEHPEARVTMPNWRAEAIASQTSTFTDLPTLNLLVQFGSQRGFLGDNDSPQFAPRLLLLGQLLLNRAIIQDAVSDINRAIECLTRAAQASQAECVTWIQISYELVNAYRMRFQRCGRIGDISSAIDYQRQIIACDGDNEKTRAHLIAGLGGLLSLRYGVSGELDDIHGAIKYATLALALTPDTNNNRTSVLNNLGIAYMRRFERLGDLEDISKAIDCQTKVIQLTPEGHSQMPNHLNNLSASYLCRFGRLGELEDISKAIGGQTRAIQLTPEGHSGMHGVGLSSWANWRTSIRQSNVKVGQFSSPQRDTQTCPPN